MLHILTNLHPESVLPYLEKTLLSGDHVVLVAEATLYAESTAAICLKKSAKISLFCPSPVADKAIPVLTAERLSDLTTAETNVRSWT